MDIRITVPGEPRTKKNSQRIVTAGKYIKVLPSKAYMEYYKSCKPFIPAYHIDNKVNVKVLYYMGSRRRVDLCNLHEAICDILVGYGCLEDDNFNIIESMDGSRVLYDKENPRAEITITTATPKPAEVIN